MTTDDWQVRIGSAFGVGAAVVGPDRAKLVVRKVKVAARDRFGWILTHEDQAVYDRLTGAVIDATVAAGDVGGLDGYLRTGVGQEAAVGAIWEHVPPEWHVDPFDTKVPQVALMLLEALSGPVT